MANPAKHVCGRDCDYDADRGCPVGDAEHFPMQAKPDSDPVIAEIDAELAYLRSKIEYLERRDGIR